MYVVCRGWGGFVAGSGIVVEPGKLIRIWWGSDLGILTVGGETSKMSGLNIDFKGVVGALEWICFAKGKSGE